MAKKILDTLVDQAGARGNSKGQGSIMEQITEQTYPITREESNTQAVDESFQGDSQYDTGLGFGVDQNKLRARNQPWYDQLGNSIAKALPGTALKMLENAGDLGELVFDNDKDKEYTNIFTELAQQGQQALNEKFHTYQETPANKFASPMDSGWWFNLGDGLVQSIGAFWATGAGVGGGLSKIAKGINGAIKAGELGLKIGQGAAQLGTASSLAYTEGIQSAAQVYQATKEQKLQEGLPIEEAKRLASEASSQTMMLNTVINTGLNITSLSPLFKSFGHLDDAVKSQLSRKAKESIPKYIARLEALEGQSVKQASIMKTLASEALQEGVEEDVNIFAENEGYLKGGVENQIRSKKGTSVDRFFDTMFSEEGAINFLSGALGGLVQTGGLEHAPIRSIKNEDGTTTRGSARDLERIELQRAQKETVSTFKNDIKALSSAQEALNTAIAKGDKVAIDQARHDLFSIAALKSIRNETSQELAQEISQIASVDNTKIGQDQLTDAQRQGLADNIDDNKYKEKAVRAAASIVSLNKEYRDLQADTFSKNPHALNEAFRHRLNLHSAQAVQTDLNQIIAEQEVKLNTLISDPNLQMAIRARAELAAYQIANQKAKEVGVTLPNDNSGAIAITEQVYSDLKKTDKSLDQKAVANQGLINQLIPLYTNRILVKARVDQRQQAYKDILNKPKDFEKAVNKDLDRLTKAVEDKKKAEVETAKNAKQQADLNQAKEEKAKETVKQGTPIFLHGTLTDPAELEKALGYPKETTPTTTKGKREVINDLPNLQEGNEDVEGQLLDATPEEVAKLKDWEKENYNLVNHTLPDGRVVSTFKLKEPEKVAVEQVSTIPAVDTAYHGKTEKEVLEETTALYDLIDQTNEQNNPLYGDHNKVAYAAQEQKQDEKATADPSIINDRYKTVHSPSFTEGTSVTLAIATGTFKAPQKADPKEYQDAIDKDIYEVPIAVWHDGKVVGWLPIYKGQGAELLAVRTMIVKGGKEVKTSISKKTLGVLNKSVKQLTKDAIKITPQFAVGNNGRFNINVDHPYEGNLGPQVAKTGFVYAIIQTPIKGREIAIPVDINNVSEQVANSIVAALNIYINQDQLDEEDRKLVEEQFHKYGINIMTRKGLQDYINLFVYTTDLSSQDNLMKLNNEHKDNYYIQVGETGIKYMQSDRALTNKKTGGLMAPEVGKNTPNPEKFYKNLRDHIKKTYVKIDLTRVEDNKAFEAPIFDITNGKLSVTTYSKPTYADHIAENTSTNIESVKISPTEQTVLVQPTMYLDYGFLGGKNIVNKKEGKTEKVVTLASNKTNLTGVASMPSRQKNPKLVDQNDAKSLKDKCT